MLPFSLEHYNYFRHKSNIYIYIKHRDSVHWNRNLQ